MSEKSADNRSVATDALATLGTIIDASQRRDAIHLAVIPLQAGQPLRPGDDVGVGGDGRAIKAAANLLGKVDPFLTRQVSVGEWFWMVIYPRQITSLRHVWSHPAFQEEVSGTGLSRETLRERSEAWLREFCKTHDCPEYETVIAVAAGYPDSNGWGENEYLQFGGEDAHGEIPDEFWDHVEVVLGRKFPTRAKYFSCSC